MPNRATELRWGPHEPEDRESARADAGGLTTAAIVKAAISVADGEGLDAVSIRRVAAELDVHPMSLYTYIASKDDLLALMANEVVGLMLAAPPLPLRWREAVSDIARRSHAAYVGHPWVFATLTRRPRLGPNVVALAKQMAEAVSGARLAPADAWTALGIVNDYVIGHAMRVATSGNARDLEQAYSDDDVAEVPELRELTEVNARRGSTEHFETGLQTVLDGIERHFLPSGDGARP
ncbi:MAG: TetR/AcrR family transcriptional regulator [Thermoleophilaceae bacterium]